MICYFLWYYDTGGTGMEQEVLGQKTRFLGKHTRTSRFGQCRYLGNKPPQTKSAEPKNRLFGGPRWPETFTGIISPNQKPDWKNKAKIPRFGQAEGVGSKLPFNTI